MGNVTFLGVEGSGKTVLTMALVNYFQVHEAEGWFLRPETRTAFRFLAQMPPVLDFDNLPHQTTKLKRLTWTMLYGERTIRSLSMLDYPGEVYRLAFLDAEDEEDPDHFQARVEANREDIEGLLEHLVRSDQVFVLFNSEDCAALAENKQNQDAVWVTNACLAYLNKLPVRPKITFLFTQIDRYVDLAQADFNAQTYLREKLPLIARNFPTLEVSAVSARAPEDPNFGLGALLKRFL